MSSKGDRNREKDKKRSLPATGEPGLVEGTGGAGGAGGGATELLIPLNQLDLDTLKRARKDDWVEVKYQNGRCEALLAGNRLGNVPAGNYEAQVRPRTPFTARLAQVSNDNPLAKISVQADE